MRDQSRGLTQSSELSLRENEPFIKHVVPSTYLLPRGCRCFLLVLRRAPLKSGWARRKPLAALKSTLLLLCPGLSGLRFVTLGVTRSGDAVLKRSRGIALLSELRSQSTAVGLSGWFGGTAVHAWSRMSVQAPPEQVLVVWGPDAFSGENQFF